MTTGEQAISHMVPDAYLTPRQFSTLLAIAALVPILLVIAWQRLRAPLNNAEWFITSGRNLQTGITSASLVAFWVGLTATLIVPKLGRDLGLSAIYGYGIGMAIPLFLLIPFSLRLKQDAPLAHTLPEWVHWRFGTRTHQLVAGIFLLLTLWYVLFALLIGTQLVHDFFPHLDRYQLFFLFVLAFLIYTVMGGLRGTILVGYVQCATIVVVTLSLAVFFCNQYGDIGIFEKLSMHPRTPSSSTFMGSTNPLVLAGFSLLLHLGLAFAHQPVWQRCIATTPRSNIQVLLIAGLATFAITIALGTVFGLGGQALGLTGIDSRWVIPGVLGAALGHTAGHNAILLFLLVVLLAVFAIGSAELVGGVAVLITDFYKRHWSKGSSDERLLLYARVWLILLSGCVVIIGFYLTSKQIPPHWLYLTSSIPVICTLPPIMIGMFWKRIHGTAASTGIIMGLLAAIAGWLVATWLEHGAISERTLFDVSTLMIGNLAGLGVSGLLSVLLSLLLPVPSQRRTVVESFLSRQDIREQDIPLDFSPRSYVQHARRTIRPVLPILAYFFAIVGVVWFIAIPLVLVFQDPEVSHGVFVMWLIGALVSFMLAGGYLLLAPIIDVFQGDDPVVLALRTDEGEGHVPEPED